MDLQDVSCAKEIFYKYNGSFFQMKRDGVYREYKKYMIPREIELQWLDEKKDEIISALLKCTNNKQIADLFAMYGHYAVQERDAVMLDFMLKYVFEHKDTWDTNTVIRNINTILSSISIIKDQNTSEVIRKCITCLEETLRKGIKISDDYIEEGKLPEYLSRERVSANIQGTINYWQEKSRGV